jgi:hypothetical protein
MLAPDRSRAASAPPFPVASRSASAPPFRDRGQLTPGASSDGHAQPATTPVFQGFPAFFGVSHMVEYTFAL